MSLPKITRNLDSAHFIYRYSASNIQLRDDIFRSNQWSTTGLSKAVVCTVLSMEKCI